MIDPFVSAAPQTAPATAKPRMILRMMENDRTAGSMPAWVRSDSAQGAVESALAAGHRAAPMALAYGPPVAGAAPAEQEQSFGFGDLLDMINPLQHIPLVNTVYRKMTGDEIRPISQILGGGIFGGPAGAASGLVNVIVQEETGTDIAGNVAQLVMTGEGPEYRIQADNPEQRLGRVLAAADRDSALSSLPGTAISFADLGAPRADALVTSSALSETIIWNGERLVPKEPRG